jgi:hypothetical protein
VVKSLISTTNFDRASLAQQKLSRKGTQSRSFFFGHWLPALTRNRAPAKNCWLTRYCTIHPFTVAWVQRPSGLGTGAGARRLSGSGTGASAHRLSGSGTGASARRLSGSGTGASARRLSGSETGASARRLSGSETGASARRLSG